MSINPAGNSNYISNESILVWMETKTDGIYGHMRNAMDTSNSRAEAEDALNRVKAKFSDDAARNLPATEALALANDAIAKYGDEFPQVKDALQNIVDDLNPKQAAFLAGPVEVERTKVDTRNHVTKYTEVVTPPPVTVDKNQTDQWSKQISDQVDALSKQDQLGLISIQEFNAQLNQAKQTASALMDAADKAASSIISHIS